MRKLQKEYVNNIIDIISKSHDEIKYYLERNNVNMALNIMPQCQDTAIELGNFIESIEGENCAPIHMLEEYCELVFRIHEDISDNAHINVNKIYKSLRKSLIQIENSVNNDIRIKKEVVFFPYKASMWDSLESVYLAAKEDQNCDAYCVPIPYYDLKPDRSFGKMHYEGDQYPKNIEITDWQTYNFEERNPDEIYIHNPYDNWNLVTSIHPRFYSKNLKEHTEKLIYIPYFVLGEIEPDNQEAIDRMKHFIWTPGVINADKVIVQSEKMKKIYVNEYLKAAQTNGLGGNHLDRDYLEKKILGLGSPKFDRVNNTKKGDLEIPQEWLKIIEKPDRSWKKIIFYNTSISALLQYNEKMLEKMKYVFGIFREKCDDVALLWRPHPLIESTIKSMRPNLWEQYKAIVDQYEQEGWGIYDDTADVDRAIVLSDGYYGDSSSVVKLYEKTNKDIMIQSVYIIKKYNWNDFFFGTRFTIVNDKAYMALAMGNCCVSVNVFTGELDYFCDLDMDYVNKNVVYYPYTGVVYKNDKLYFSPNNVKKISVFSNHKLESIDLKIPSNFMCGKHNYSFCIEFNEYIFFVGVCRTNAIACLNTETGDIKYYGYVICKDELLNNKAVYGKNSVIVKETLYIPLLGKGQIYALNISIGEERIIKILNLDDEISTINYYNENFYITTIEGKLIKWDLDKLYDIKLSNTGRFYSSLCCCDRLFLFPVNKDEDVIIISLVDQNINRLKIPYIIYDSYNIDKKIILNTIGGFCIYDIESGTLERVEFKSQISGNEFAQKHGMHSEKNIYRYEGMPEYNTLEIFIENLGEKSNESK
jgi:hypothetical protein